ncbi:molybdopterin-binding protein [Fusobacterium sp. PH5-44]|uniref:molybdopterin-binding protein n=1 Tax=unclassified Fusobacterium TaxID=2648384 RepID=UPI003D1E375C
MKEVKVENAVGMILCHDITEIVPEKFKGTAFRKGHVIKEEDIEKFLDLGKKNIFVWDLEEGYIHENDAAYKMVKSTIGQGIQYDEPKEGKINLIAAHKGILKINTELLYELNGLGDICFATIHGNKLVEKGQLLGGARAIPLVIKEEIIERFKKLSEEKFPLIEILPLKKAKIGVVVTGSEIESGRIEDKFYPVLKKKAEELNGEIIGKIMSGDDPVRIKNAIMNFIGSGVDLVEVTGGMSVDPDDKTPLAIRSCDGEVITYGTPVLPGAMFMLSYVKGIPVVGLPGCVMYSKRTIYDLVVPRLLAKERLNKIDFIKLAYGGQCQNCELCIYPNCGFGQ